MQQKQLFILLIGFTIAASSSAQLKYPAANKVNQTDDYFGVKVADPYRWLEDDNSKITGEWVEEQNKLTAGYLSTIPFRDKVGRRLADMWNYARYSSPFREGDYYYYYKNDGLQNQSVLYRQRTLTSAPEVFIDANKLSADGTAVPGVPSFTKSARYCAYLQAESGSDWQEAFVMDVQSGKLMADKIKWIKFSGIAWKGDHGFYYSRYPEATEQNKLSRQNQYHTVYYHQLGTPQSADLLIYEDRDHPLRTITASLTEEERYLIINKSEGTSGKEIWVADLLEQPVKSKPVFTKLITGFDYEARVINSDGDRLLVLTNVNAPNYRVVSVSPASPAMNQWKEIIPTRTKLLQGAATGGSKLFLTYLEDASSKVYQCNLQGNLEREIPLPGIGTASGFGGKKEEKEFFYSYTSFNSPPTIYRYSIADGKSSLFRKPDVKINPEDYETVQSFFKSSDSTNVPLFITYKKGLKRDGNNPTLIYGYGGFNIPMTPSFSISNAFFLEQGGVYVVVNLRGGNEYGEAWHKAGMLQRKQQVFDDVYGAVAFLTRTKYTNPSKIALRGGSNGGLLVGACITQHPELFKVAIPQVGVLDMLRYHQFTIGWAWATEYGRSDKREDFENLYRYSPLHNLKKGQNYPATLITTADHDDRVVPAHSFKFAATLQEVNDGPNPTLIRIDKKAGHGAGKPTAKMIEEATDIWSFVMYHLGMNFKETP